MKTIGQCPRCERVTLRAEGECLSGKCIPGDRAVLQPVAGCEWKARDDESEPLECERCGGTDLPLPLAVEPVRACGGAA